MGIMDLFFVKDEEPKKEEAQESKQPQQETPAPTIAKTPTPPTAETAKPDETIAQTFIDAIEAANVPGFDYLEFAKVVDSLKPSIPAEQAQYTTALTSAQAIDKSVTYDKLIETSGVYVKVLQDKEEEFKTFLSNKYSADIDSKEAKIISIDDQIKNRAEQIQRITEEINDLSNTKVSITNEISESKSKIEQVKNNFYATYQLFIGKINSDVEKIKKYLSK